uniref:Lipocalin n=1 Tax=Rhipicephalus appendiculatus TaxID=34631 RepID=A0A131YV64_RHIAP
MAEKQLCLSVLILALTTLANGSFICGIGNCWRLDIRPFVGTTQRIWTYNTSASSYIRCKVDQARNLSKTSIFFRRAYFYDEQHRWIAKNLEGLFSKKQKDVMQVRNQAHVFIDKEKILYLNMKYRCAVIKVTQAHLGWESYYELRLWDAWVKQGPHAKCVLQFARHTHKGKVIYGPFCDNILHIK